MGVFGPAQMPPEDDEDEDDEVSPVEVGALPPAPSAPPVGSNGTIWVSQAIEAKQRPRSTAPRSVRVISILRGARRLQIRSGEARRLSEAILRRDHRTLMGP
jgi:hypothetical protein